MSNSTYSAHRRKTEYQAGSLSLRGAVSMGSGQTHVESH